MTRLKKNQNVLEQDSSSSDKTKDAYKSFDKINGLHPLRNETINSHILYPARVRPGAEVVVFNFSLARQMGLISKNHPDKMTKELKSKIIDTFALVIINEYDQTNGIKFPKKTIKKNRYMATRYLQLQHPNKQGKTSGDGRSIWNGRVKHKGVTWDISSCGTGATSLSPATHIQKKFFQTGDPSISYGCGYAEVDEGLASLFFSEVLHKNQVTTERVLGILRFPDGFAITIRTHNNLIRPSHMFNHLKQQNYDALKQMVEYYINRQEQNGVWTDIPKRANDRYDYFLKKQVEVFAKTAAKFEDEYIFCWLDWDGDNVLMDGGIIDYGSVRQFGLFHSEYRFDDDDRFSTSISEQKKNAKYTVQTFAQIVDYLKTRKRKSLKDFSATQWSKNFESSFKKYKYKNILYKIGLKKETRDYLIEHSSELIEEFLQVFSYFERAKSSKGIKKVNDGINWDAIFCMRDLLRELPQFYLSRADEIKRSEFIEIMRSSYASDDDLEMTNYRKRKIDEFQKRYWQLMTLACSYEKKTINVLLLDVTMRSSIINKYDRITGDSITTIVEMLMEDIKNVNPDKLYRLLYHFSEYQNLNPEYERTIEKEDWHKSKLMRGFLKIVREYREGL